MDMMEFLRTRRTYRRFDQRPIAPEILTEAIDAARLASCGANRQTVRYILVQSARAVSAVQPLVHWAAYLPPEQGIGDATDDRRGEGVYDRVMHAMDLMKENGLLFGTSICYTSANYKAVTSDEFMDMLISHGVRFNWYFHYMPIGDGANVDLMLNAEQREYMIHRVREIRGFTGGKPIFCIDFQNDGEYIDGCIAGGRQYAHINPAGDVEPCVFIHYSNANIHDKSLLECLQQPLFKEYHKGQPFNNNHLRPCPMLENPELLGEMVKRSGAHSTDMQQPESTDDVFRRCRPYADQWTPSAERIWAEEHPGCTSCASCSGCASK